MSQLADRLDLAAETVRRHLKTLAGYDLVRRVGTRKDGPGRPEIAWIRELPGDDLTRRSWMPEGDRACTSVAG